MPWSPPSDDVLPQDPRLDPYRDRAGVLLVDGVEVARLYLGTGPFWTRTGGHLWWSRWSAPAEAVEGHVLWADGGRTEWFATGDELARDLAEWEVGTFSQEGTAYRVVWLDDDESARVRAEILAGQDGSG